MMIDKKNMGERERERERERELQMIPITAMNQAIEDSRVATTKKMRRLELLCCFLGKIKFYIIFM